MVTVRLPQARALASVSKHRSILLPWIAPPVSARHAVAVPGNVDPRAQRDDAGVDSDDSVAGGSPGGRARAHAVDSRERTPWSMTESLVPTTGSLAAGLTTVEERATWTLVRLVPTATTSSTGS